MITAKMSNSRDVRRFIFDTSCLNYFALTSNLHLLEARYAGKAVIPREVKRELERGLPLHPELSPILDSKWLEVIRLEGIEDLELFNELRKRWGEADRNHGEAAILVLAKRCDLVAVIDELVGRTTAREMDIKCVGTVGIIAGMVRDEEITESRGWKIHQDMVSLGFRSLIKNRGEFNQLCR